MPASSVTSDYSVGDAMAKGGTILAVGSVTYNAITAKLVQKVREQAAAEQQRRANARALPVPYAVSAERMRVIGDLYPEFSLISVPIESVVHGSLEVERMVATANCMERLRSVATGVLALGNTCLVSALMGMRHVHSEMSPHDVYAVHANHTAAQIYHKLATKASGIFRETGYQLDPICYRDFRRGAAFQVCDSEVKCQTRADTFFADLSIYPMSLTQYCAGMASCGATVGDALIPYSADMLVALKGEWGDTGVFYEVTRDALLFKYPDGVAGATSYDLGAWLEWIRSGSAIIRHQDRQFNYQIELAGVRGAYLLATVTLVSHLDAPGISFATHALDLPSTRDDMYIVRSYRLKSLQHDPIKSSSYEPVQYTAPKRIADRVFQHAMSLKKEAFKDSTVLKRVSVMDGRVTFAGMSVKVDRPIDVNTFTQLTQDVMLRAFVARYHMGELGSDLMKQLSSIKGFASAGTPMKIAYLAVALLKCAWNWTFQILIDALRGLVDKGLRLITGRGKSVMPEFNPAPAFIAFDTYTTWMSRKVMSRVQGAVGGNVLVPYLRGARAAYHAAKRIQPSLQPKLPALGAPGVVVAPHGLYDEIEDTRDSAAITEQGRAFVEVMRELNEVHEGPANRFDIPSVRAVYNKDVYDYGTEDYLHDPGYVDTLNTCHEKQFPGMRQQNFEADNASLHQDPQHRIIVTDDARFAAVSTDVPKSYEVYKSNIHSYRTERRMQTLPQLLTALDARQLAVPQISEPMNVERLVLETWDNFLDVCCVPDARERIAEFKRDSVGFEQEALLEWTKKADPKKIEAMLKELAESVATLEEYDISLFKVMVKSDAKPPLSTKPIKEQLAPQVIVYHERVLSAAFSSIYRVLTRRFLSLLKPNFLVMLLGDDQVAEDHASTFYPWGEAVKLAVLENDYSKYDKSQSEVCVRLDQYSDEQLGFRFDLLDAWYKGHERSKIVCVRSGLKLWIDWQRRSGGSNTAFGNVKINIMTTAYVYRGSDIVYAVYIGDDSWLMCRSVVADKESVRALGDRYNLQAKFICPQYPYFASRFWLFDEEQRRVLSVPDPYKRTQRLGLSVGAVDPNWPDRIRSHHENCHAYKFRKIHKMLKPAVAERYQVGNDQDLDALFNALASSAADEQSTRDCWEEKTSIVYVV